MREITTNAINKRFDFEIGINHSMTTWHDMIVLQCTNTWRNNKC